MFHLHEGSTIAVAQVKDLGLQGQYADETWLGKTIFTVAASSFFSFSGLTEVGQHYNNKQYELDVKDDGNLSLLWRTKTSK